MAPKITCGVKYFCGLHLQPAAPPQSDLNLQNFLAGAVIVSLMLCIVTSPQVDPESAGTGLGGLGVRPRMDISRREFGPEDHQSYAVKMCSGRLMWSVPATSLAPNPLTTHSSISSSTISRISSHFSTSVSLRPSGMVSEISQLPAFVNVIFERLRENH